ncbi:MAG: siroheme synthase, partial [Deltaproteobacteria bacterium]|nr:siroheme synthase [Deltaproteobacteria bacterium]
EGKIVVRLKSGDPLVFGRGGEEASFLSENGIPFEIVPGITAALSCAADAGIPLTDRRYSSSVTFFSGVDGEECKNRDEAPSNTFVVYMGIEAASSVREKLLERGLAETTPIAVIEKGGSAGRRVFFSSVAGLPECVSSNGIESPALIIAGEVVGHAVASQSCFTSPASARSESLL